MSTLLRVAALMACLLGVIAPVYAEEFPHDFYPREIKLDPKHGRGIMVAAWQGKHPLDFYESRWISFVVRDKVEQKLITFDMWITSWAGTCSAPCTLRLDFMLENMEYIEQ